MDNVVDQLFRSAYHLQHSNSIQDYGHPQQHPQHPHHQQHLYSQHPQQTQSPQIGGPIQLQQLGQPQHDVYGRPYHPQQHEYRAHPQYVPPPSHAPTHHQHQHVHPHPHAPHVPRPPSRTGSPSGMDDLDVGTPGIDEDYLVAHHTHPTHQQQQQMHMQHQHMRARELELENDDASGSALAGPSTQTGYDPSSVSASALNPTAALPMDHSFDEEPLYVNAKQYYRILKRRLARQRLDELHRLSRQRKPYLHESRHKHAMRRPRGPGGRFLTAEEIAAQKASQTHQDGGESDTSQPEGHGENDLSQQDNRTNNSSPQKVVLERSLSGPKRALQPQPTSQSSLKQNEVQNGNVAPNLLSLNIPNEEHDVKPMQQSHAGMFIPSTFTVDTNPDGSVTLREPYSPQQPSASGQSPTSYFSGRDQSESDVQAGTSPQLHHVPHPHSHHSHMHQRRRTHMHSQTPRNEAGGLYTPFDIPVPVEISLLSSDQSTNGDVLAGMSGADGSQIAMNGMGMIGLNGNQPAPGEVRVTPGMPLTGSAQADLQRRTDEILAFSARSMGSAGTGESGR